MLKLNAEWTAMMHQYDLDHQDRRNRACHRIGIPLIALSAPLAATVVGLPLAATTFTLGWAFQFVGHLFEGKQPSFVGDKRYLTVGLIWWLKKSGVAIELHDDQVQKAAPPSDTTVAPY
jgi:uncharacterized membrane protein YGL010W